VELCPSTTSGGLAENIKHEINVHWSCISCYLTIFSHTELHLLEYNWTKLEYLEYYEIRKRRASLFPPVLKNFTRPWDANGYRDKSITDDLITDVYTTFSDRTRSSESQAYL
jgi:hypothetical protein